jgi:hypothetical protein
MIAIRSTAARLRREESGVTMMIVLGVMVVVTALVAAALTLTANNQQNVSRTVAAAKAYNAAEAGVNFALAQLNESTNNWETCPKLTTPQIVDFDQPANSTEAPYEESFIYETLPAHTSYSGSSPSACVANSPDTILDATPGSAGDLRMLFTGYAGHKSASVGQLESRKIVASFSPVSFTRYLYFTNYEILDPSIVWPNETSSNKESATCSTKYYYEGRSTEQVSASESSPGTKCLALRFMNPGDNVNGPLWSNDSLDICEAGVSLGGKTSTNTVEARESSSTGSANYCDSGGTYTPEVDGSTSVGVSKTEGTKLIPPTSLTPIESTVTSNPTWGCHFEGPTDITLNGTEVEGSNAKYYTLYKPAKSYSYNYCRVIYVSPNTASGVKCSVAYTPFSSPYDDPLNSSLTVGSNEYLGGNKPNSKNEYEQTTEGSDGGCGDVYVKGSYSRSLTIVAAGDIVIDGNITNTSPNKTAVLGLAATNWVRIFHPVEGNPKPEASCTGDANKTGYLQEPTIEAAILADKHSFIVDNYNCGAKLGKLNVVGSIAQNYRGPVASPLNSGTLTSGYEKNYTYNPILATDDPPYFPTPEGADWIVARQTLCYGTSASPCS